MYTLKFTLKQHTPLIHFQHDQDGATLRASEVKPKLDRFIIDAYGLTVNGKPKEEYKKYFIGEGKNNMALDYQMRIDSENIKQIIINEGRKNSPPFYFANMGEDYRSNPKYLNWTEDPICLTFLLKNNFATEDYGNLSTILFDIIPEFLLKSNFGARSSKGYGSFYIHSSDENYIKPSDLNRQLIQNNAYLKYKLNFQIVSNLNNTNLKSKEVLKQLEVFYKAMKSGINICYGKEQFYIKSLIWLYFNKINSINKNIGIKWEKKKTKEVFFNTKIIQELRDHGSKNTNTNFEESPLGKVSTNEIAIKDMLGYTEKESWSEKYNAVINKSINDVTRYMSPITFKVIEEDNNFVVFLIFTDTPFELKNVDINFSNNLNSSLFSMKTPMNFKASKLVDFLGSNSFLLDKHFIIKQGDENILAKSLVDENNEIQIREYHTLKKIIDQLKIQHAN